MVHSCGAAGAALNNARSIRMPLIILMMHMEDDKYSTDLKIFMFIRLPRSEAHRPCPTGHPHKIIGDGALSKPVDVACLERK